MIVPQDPHGLAENPSWHPLLRLVFIKPNGEINIQLLMERNLHLNEYIFVTYSTRECASVMMVISDGLWLSEQVSPNKMYPPNHAYNLENRGKSPRPYLNIHILRDYFFRLHSNHFPATIGSFCTNKIILNNGGVLPCDLQLNILLLLVGIQCPLRSRRDLDPARLICTLKCSCIDCTDGQTDWFFYTEKCFSRDSHTHIYIYIYIYI
jgi:hypothetical protein